MYRVELHGFPQHAGLYPEVWLNLFEFLKILQEGQISFLDKITYTEIWDRNYNAQEAARTIGTRVNPSAPHQLPFISNLDDL